MSFEWDEAKRWANLRKHGIDFVGCETIFAGYSITTLDDRGDHGEERFVTIGLLEGRVVSVCHTETDEVIRIISIRKATRYEQETFLECLPDGLETR